MRDYLHALALSLALFIPTLYAATNDSVPVDVSANLPSTPAVDVDTNAPIDSADKADSIAQKNRPEHVVTVRPLSATARFFGGIFLAEQAAVLGDDKYAIAVYQRLLNYRFRTEFAERIISLLALNYQSDHAENVLKTWEKQGDIDNADYRYAKWLIALSREKIADITPYLSEALRDTPNGLLHQILARLLNIINDQYGHAPRNFAQKIHVFAAQHPELHYANIADFFALSNLKRPKQAARAWVRIVQTDEELSRPSREAIGKMVALHPEILREFSRLLPFEELNDEWKFYYIQLLIRHDPQNALALALPWLHQHFDDNSYVPYTAEQAFRLVMQQPKYTKDFLPLADQLLTSDKKDEAQAIAFFVGRYYLFNHQILQAAKYAVKINDTAVKDYFYDEIFAQIQKLRQKERGDTLKKLLPLLLQDTSVTPYVRAVKILDMTDAAALNDTGYLHQN